MKAANKSSSIFRFSVVSLVAVTDSYPAHNYGVLTSECIDRVQHDFANLPKTEKIQVNGKLMGFYGFDGSSDSLVTLSVAKSNVRLPITLNYTNLLLLDASYNNLGHIDDIGNFTFPSLRLFNLSHNSIVNIQSHVFGHLKEVEILDLSHNCFVNFNPGLTFIRHENLKKLYLQNNLLHVIQFSLGEPKQMTLEVFDIANNFIEEFANFGVQINHLNMQNNAIRSAIIMHADQMVLQAQQNQMVHLIAPQGTFKMLNLSHNGFSLMSYIEVDAARVLDVSHNQLERWSTEGESEEYVYDDSVSDTDDSVAGLLADDRKALNEALQLTTGIKVQYLNLAQNNISSINELRHYKDCLVLNLESNQLSNIDPEHFRMQFPMLKRVNLIDNPLTPADETHLQFFNHTYLLQLHFDYGTTTVAPPMSTFLPPLPPITLLLPPSITASKIIARTDSTTSTPTTSKSPQTESSTHSKSIIVTTEAHRDERTTIKPSHDESFPVWMFALVFAAIIVTSIIYMTHNRTTKSDSRFFNHGGYNDTENFL